MNTTRWTITFAAPALWLLGTGTGLAQDDAETSASPVVTEAAAPHRTAAAVDARVFIVSPKDGAVVSSPFKVVFGIAGMTLAPAGTAAPMTGHHHLFIDTAPGNPDEPIPASDRVLHFGKAQTGTTLSLPPGRHTLQLELGDGQHVPHDPPVLSEIVTITVK